MEMGWHGKDLNFCTGSWASVYVVGILWCGSGFTEECAFK